MAKTKMEKQVAENSKNIASIADSIAQLTQLMAKGMIKKQAVGKTATANKDANTHRNEPIVNTVKCTGTRDTAKGTGVMANFKSTVGKKNYSVFVPTKHTDALVQGKEFKVTQHESKESGNISHAIWVKPTVARYASAKTKTE